MPGAPPTMFAPPGSMYCGPPLGMAMPPQRPMTGGLGIMAVPPPLATPKPPLVPPPATEANAWREYTDTTGRAYYHDTRSNKTTYEKPACLKSAAERTLAPCKWKEYPTPDGRNYYSDDYRMSSVFQPPMKQPCSAATRSAFSTTYWSCVLCGLTGMTSEKQLQQHVASKGHTKKLRASGSTMLGQAKPPERRDNTQTKAAAEEDPPALFVTQTKAAAEEDP